MKKFISSSIFAIFLAVAVLSFTSPASAEELKMVGTISKIEMAADGKSATAVLKDTKSGAEVPILITDELTLDKFKDKRIIVDDEIRCRYDNESGKNLSKSFKKTAGC
jgi:hypothetical protein